jgi:hypothetical protein
MGRKGALVTVWCVLRADRVVRHYGAASKILSCIKLRGKSPEKPKGFFWSVQGGPGGNRNPPRARFLFPIFSFGEAKENAGQQPQISNTSSYLAVRLKMLRLFVYSTPVTS